MGKKITGQDCHGQEKQMGNKFVSLDCDGQEKQMEKQNSVKGKSGNFIIGQGDFQRTLKVVEKLETSKFIAEAIYIQKIFCFCSTLGEIDHAKSNNLPPTTHTHTHTHREREREREGESSL